MTPTPASTNPAAATSLTARLTASRTYQPSRPSETTYGDCLAACSWAWKAWRTITRPSAQRSVSNPAFSVVTSPITGQTVPSGHGRSAGSVRDRLGGRRPQAPGPGAPDRADGLDPLGGQRPDLAVDLADDHRRVQRVARRGHGALGGREVAWATPRSTQRRRSSSAVGPSAATSSQPF